MRELLRYDQQELQSGFEKAGLEGAGTPQEVADRREKLVKSFLEKYFPFPYRVTKGNIIDSFGKRSSSIDCVILNPAHPYTIDVKSNLPSIILADGVDFAIEVKGDLNSTSEVERALEQIRSVKKLRRVKDNNLGKGTEYLKRINCIIYANKTRKESDLINDILEYYYNSRVGRIEQFDMIATPEKIIFNSCKELPSFFGNRDLCFIDSGKDSLLALLFCMSTFPLSEVRMNRDILNIYLRKFMEGMNTRSIQGISEVLQEIDDMSI